MSQGILSQPSNAPGVARNVFQALLANRVVTIVVAVVLVLLLVGLFDTVSNIGKAYGNVSINGISVAGMNEEQIVAALESEYGARLSETEVTIYANQEAAELDYLTAAEKRAQAQQISAEEAEATAMAWVTSASDLQGWLPYADAAKKALAVGRDDGGLPTRLGLFLFPRNIDLVMDFDDELVDKLASSVDKAIGDERVDASVKYENGSVGIIEGHDGSMVDRAQLATTISKLIMSPDDEDSFIAVAVSAPSRTTYEQAERARDALTKVIGSEAEFSYDGKKWTASGDDMASWTKAEPVAENGGYDIGLSIDPAIAMPAIEKGAEASVDSDKVFVTFEVSGDEVNVHTSGEGEIPEVASAVTQLDDALYGSDGIAYSQSGSAGKPAIEIGATTADESMSLDEAVELGVVEVIGEYTTKYSNKEGTENRNHNIHVVADIINNSIAEADGGTWSFNDHSGDTTQDPPFTSAGSIIGGEYVDSVGGGICQVATTVFNAVLEAGLEVKQRHNHTVYMQSYPSGRDASVSYGELDFVWANQLKSDVLLKMSYTDTTVTAQLYGVHTGYEVSMQESQWQAGDTYGTSYEVDNSLAPGGYYTKTTGVNGHSTSVTRTVKDEKGEEVLTDTYDSTYTPKDAVIAVSPGTDTTYLAG